jgi:hypothetical protein
LFTVISKLKKSSLKNWWVSNNVGYRLRSFFCEYLMLNKNVAFNLLSLKK